MYGEYHAPAHGYGRAFLDVVSHGTKTIYDWKTGMATMSPSQLAKYQAYWPGYQILVIHP